MRRVIDEDSLLLIFFSRISKRSDRHRDPDSGQSVEIRQVRVIDISTDARSPNTFHVINATGYSFVGQVNQERFMLSEAYGVDQVIGFEPMVILREGRVNKMLVLVEFAYEKEGRWKQLHSLKQYLHWKEGTSKVVVLLRDPEKQLAHDINLIRLN